KLGSFYEDGHFGKIDRPDYKKAIGFYREAAKLGSHEAMLNLARCCEQGIGLDKNMELAIYWTNLAIESGNDCQAKLKEQADDDNPPCITSKLGLATCYEKGICGLPKNMEKAIKICAYAIKDKSPEAREKMVEYGMHYHKKGDKQNLIKARELY